MPIAGVDGTCTGKHIIMRDTLDSGYQFDDEQTAENLPHQKAFRKHFLGLLEHAGVEKNVKGIEIGPGLGDFMSFLTAAGFTISAIEPSKDACRILRDRYPKAQVTNQSGYETIKRPGDEHFFYALEVIEHCFDPDLLLQKFNHSMKMGEVLVLSTPYHGYLKNLLISLLGKWDSHHDVFWKVGHIKFFSIKTLSKMLSLNGFSIVAIKCYGRIPLLSRGMFFVARKTSETKNQWEDME
jgi:hypothetical protein